MKNIQMVMMGHPKNLNAPDPWWISNESTTPFYYFSPAPLFNGAVTLESRQKLQLNYRVLVQSVELTEEQIEKLYETYAGTK